MKTPKTLIQHALFLIYSLIFWIISQSAMAVSVPANQQVFLDFRDSDFIEQSSIFEMVCDTTGCSPITTIRPMDQDVQALWRLDSIDDDMVTDETTNLYNMTITGELESMATGLCVHGGCLNFTGDSVNYAYASKGPFGDSVLPDTGYTLSFWMYPRALSGYVFASFYSSRVYFKESSGELVYYVQGTPSHGQVSVDSESVSTMLNDWTQLSIRFDNEAEELSIFINGDLYRTVHFSMESFEHGTQNFTIGNSMSHNEDDQFDGMVDEFVVYNTPLNDAAIQQLYSESRPPALVNANFKTKDLEFETPIESFEGTVQDSSDATRIDFSTDGGDKWCEMTEGEQMDQKTYCYFPTDNLQLKFTPTANTTVESFTFNSSTEHTSKNRGVFPMGMNLAGLSYYSRQLLFADAMKRATTFVATDYPWWSGTEVAYENVFSDQGYPRYAPMEMFDTDGGSLGMQGFTTFLYLHAEGEYPSGEYLLFYEGEGIVKLAGDAGNHTIDSDGAGEVRYPFAVSIPTGAGFSLTICESNENNPVRNIRLVVPGHETTFRNNPFYLPLLEKFKDFESYRFMDLMRTNNQNAEFWGDVRPVDYYSQSSQYPLYSGVNPGLSPEYLIRLANLTGVDPWFCIPHKADEGYIRNLAKLIHENLDPNLKVYVEYSNELWNWMFQQTHYCLAQGKELQLDDDDNRAKAKFILKRTVEIFAIFEDQFGGDKGRLVKVIAGQSASTSVLNSILQYLDDSTLNPNTIRFDAIAIAPYIHISDEDVLRLAPAVSEITYEQVAQLCLKAIFKDNETHIAAHSTMADEYGVQLLAYEGGQHLGFDLDPNDPVENDLITLYTGMNRNEVIGVLTNELLDVWGEYSDGLFAYFSSIGSYGRYGSWGAYESTFENDTAKSRILQEWTDARQELLLSKYDYNDDTRIDLEDLILGLRVLSGYSVDIPAGHFGAGEHLGLRECLIILQGLGAE